MLILYYDICTTGTDPAKHALVRITGVLEKDGVVLETVDLAIRPFAGDIPDAEFMRAHGLEKDRLIAYPKADDQLRAFAKALASHMGTSKIQLCGWNTTERNDLFLRRWFEKSGFKNFQDFFFYPSIDTMLLCAVFFAGKREFLPNFLMRTVCGELGIAYDDGKAFDPSYRVSIIRQIPRKLKVVAR